LSHRRVRVGRVLRLFFAQLGDTLVNLALPLNDAP
jgi:hypothetical protein